MLEETKNTNKKILGIDEAGRGPIIGSLVICGALINEDKLKDLEKLGLKDSKMLSPKQREGLIPKIKEVITDYKVVQVSAEEIDSRFNVNTNLNQLEAVKSADIINELRPDLVFIDAPSVNPEEFKKYLKRYLITDCEIIAEHKADCNYPVVSAASIIAKVSRDASVKEIERTTGIIAGSGYPHDELAIKFVEESFNNKELKKYIRHTWSTYTNIKQGKEQKRLGEF